jgi:hypothetical protein
VHSRTAHIMTSLMLDRLHVLPMRCSAGSACAWRLRRPGHIVVAVAATRLANVDCLPPILWALPHTASALPRRRARRTK